TAGRRPIPGGSAALGTSWPHTQGAEEEVPVLPGACHLDYRVIAGEGYDHRIVADPPDLAGFGRPQRAGDIIDRDQGVAQQEGRRGPDEDVADPAAVAAVPAPRDRHHQQQPRTIAPRPDHRRTARHRPDL